MIEEYFPLICAVLGTVIAQAIKPFIYYIFHRKWDFSLVVANGMMPSSHSSCVTALTLAIGIKEGFNSSLFAMSFAFAVIICFDAANVRYYAGQNISTTQKLIDDLKELTTIPIDFESEEYNKKMKEVLGHTYTEVFGGILLGIIIPLVLQLFI